MKPTGIGNEIEATRKGLPKSDEPKRRCG